MSQSFKTGIKRGKSTQSRALEVIIMYYYLQYCVKQI